eukprot:Nk52_evm112s914 gene=Nk52_evmTU112s914
MAQKDPHVLRVAVVGGGVSGLVSAYLLKRQGDCSVTLFEKEERLGGHALTVHKEGLPHIDLGFQVFNLTTYGHLSGLFRELDVDTMPSCMSLSCRVAKSNTETGEEEEFEWGSRDGLFSVFPTFSSLGEASKRLTLLADIIRFGRVVPKEFSSVAESECSKGKLSDPDAGGVDETIGQYLKRNNYSLVFREAYVEPMLGSIWSVPGQTAMQFPMKSLAIFLSNHHLFSTVWPPRPIWRVLTERSESYVEKIKEYLDGDVCLGCGIKKVVSRSDGPNGIVLEDWNGNLHSFDKLILATHSDISLRILDECASPLERKVLRAIPYHSNRCILHKDSSVMPKCRKLWSSWNSAVIDGEYQSCTYWLNHLQKLPEGTPELFLTLNPSKLPQDVIDEYELHHPVLTSKGIEAQQKLPEIQGTNGIYYAGAWCGFGFHEDGIKSAVNATSLLGCRVPWKVLPTSPVPPSFKSLLAFNVIDLYFSRTISNGCLRIILPNGKERMYGENPLALKSTSTGPRSVIRVYNLDFFSVLLFHNAIGLGEAYIEQLFDIDGPSDNMAQLTDVFASNIKLINHLSVFLKPFFSSFSKKTVKDHSSRQNSIPQAKKNILAHYDKGNDFYSEILDESMTYSCALFEKSEFETKKDSNEETLLSGQQRKMRTILKRAKVSRGHHVLEIGCGWGATAVLAVKEFGCTWTGITLSEAQKAYCDQVIEKEGLQASITIELVDYRVFMSRPENQKRFDRIVSIEMIEAVGHEHFPIYFKSIDQVLVDGGFAAIQAITIPNERYDSYCRSSDFIREYVFPGGHLPCLKEIEKNLPETLVLCSKKAFGKHYADTLRRWRLNMNNNSEVLLQRGYNEKLQRLFTWYFLICESGFRYSLIDTYHITFQCRRTGSVPRPFSSAIYSGSIYHGRLERRSSSSESPSDGGFRYLNAMQFIDLEHADELNNILLKNIWSPITKFHAEDYGPGENPHLVDILRRQGVEPVELEELSPSEKLVLLIRTVAKDELKRELNGPIYLLTTIRSLGYCFNPISVYYIFESSSSSIVDAIILEVTNTPWLEKKLYVLDASNAPSKYIGQDIYKQVEFRKELHVSPFFGMDYRYQLEFSTPEDRLKIRLKLLKDIPCDSHGSEPPKMNAEVVFLTRLNLQRKKLIKENSTDIAEFQNQAKDEANISLGLKDTLLWRIAFMPWIAQLWIHYQALVLFAIRGKRVFKVRHEEYERDGLLYKVSLSAYDLIKHICIFLIGMVGLFLIKGLEYVNGP